MEVTVHRPKPTRSRRLMSGGSYLKLGDDYGSTITLYFDAPLHMVEAIANAINAALRYEPEPEPEPEPMTYDEALDVVRDAAARMADARKLK